MRSLAVVSLLALGAAVPALGAGRTGAPATVAHTTTVDGIAADLQVQDTSSGGLCLDLSLAGAVRADPSCVAPPSTPEGDVQPRQVRAGSALIVYGAVSAGTRAVRLTLPAGRARTVATVAPSTYGGAFAGRVRFYLAALAAPAVGAATALDAAGRPLASRDLNPMALPPLHLRRDVARLHDEIGRAARLVALDAAVLVRQPDARRRAVCVGIKPAGSATALPGRSLCVTKSTRVDLRFAADCQSGRTVLYGVVPAVVRRMSVFLSGGSRRTMRLVALPRRISSARAVLLELAAGTPDSVVAYGAGGRRLATVRLAPGNSC
jgi:hypothetical protein